MTILPGTSPTTMKHRILRAAADLKSPVTIRTVPGGLLFWRSTDDNIQHAKAVAQRLQSAQRGPAGRRRTALCARDNHLDKQDRDNTILTFVGVTIDGGG
jgi:hypothetical protein